MTVEIEREDVALLRDERVVDALVRMYGTEQAAYDAGADKLATWNDDSDPFSWGAFSFPVRVDQGNLLYLLARTSGARHVVEFATSFGFSTVFLAAAVRDNGGGAVTSAELVPEKVEVARANLEAAGLASYVDLRVGDALETLADVGPGIDLLLLDGWPTGDSPSVARRVLDLLTPKLRPGAVVFDDNGEPDCVDRLLHPDSGFRCAAAPLTVGGFVAVYDPVPGAVPAQRP